MFGNDFIQFIKKNQLEECRIMEGDGQDLPGFVTLEEFCQDFSVKPRIAEAWIQCGFVPEALHIGKVWYVPCDLILVSQAGLGKANKVDEDDVYAGDEPLLIL